jgi:hypothetical protein
MNILLWLQSKMPKFTGLTIIQGDARISSSGIIKVTGTIS